MQVDIKAASGKSFRVSFQISDVTNNCGLKQLYNILIERRIVNGVYDGGIISLKEMIELVDSDTFDSAVMSGGSVGAYIMSCRPKGLPDKGAYYINTGHVVSIFARSKRGAFFSGPMLGNTSHQVSDNGLIMPAVWVPQSKLHNLVVTRTRSRLPKTMPNLWPDRWSKTAATSVISAALKALSFKWKVDINDRFKPANKSASNKATTERAGDGGAMPAMQGGLDF